MPDHTPLPALPWHPEPHAFTWSALERATIERYGRECFEAGAADLERRLAEAYTGEQIYAAWLAMGIDMRCLDWAVFVEKLDAARSASQATGEANDR